MCHTNKKRPAPVGGNQQRAGGQGGGGRELPPLSCHAARFAPVFEGGLDHGQGQTVFPAGPSTQRTPAQRALSWPHRESVTLRHVPRMRYFQTLQPSRNSSQPVGISAPTNAADWLPRSIYRGCATACNQPLVSHARSDRPRNRDHGSLRQATRTAPTCDRG